MPSLSFNARFATRVESGAKVQSIRGKRKNPAQWMPGKPIYLFTAMRTKHCRRLGAGVITNVHDVCILQNNVEIDGIPFRRESDLNAFARGDGFSHWVDFISFFSETYGLPWHGSLIKWRLEAKS